MDEVWIPDVVLLQGKSQSHKTKILQNALTSYTNPLKFLKLSGYQLSLVIRTTGSRCEGGESPAKAGVQLLDLQDIPLEIQAD